MVDHPSDLDNSASSLQSKEGNQSRQEPLTEQNRHTIDTVPAEIRDNIMRQAMRGAPDNQSQADAFATANALRQVNQNYRQTLVSNPTTLGAEFQSLTRDTLGARAQIARDETGGPGDERTADSVIARRGPFPQSVAEDVRRVGALHEVRDHGMNASDANSRHGVTNPEHRNQTVTYEQTHLRGLGNRNDRGGRGR